MNLRIKPSLVCRKADSILCYNATEVAAEGTGLTHGISTLIAQEWVDAIIKLYDDEELWTKFAENSQRLVEAKNSFEHGHKAFKAIFASVGVYSSK
jgi:hypothetical protein